MGRLSSDAAAVYAATGAGAATVVATSVVREIDFEVEDLDEISGETASLPLLPTPAAATTATAMDTDHADNADGAIADADAGAGADAGTDAAADAAGTLAAAAGGATPRSRDDAAVDARPRCARLCPRQRRSTCMRACSRRSPHPRLPIRCRCRCPLGRSQPSRLISAWRREDHPRKPRPRGEETSRAFTLSGRGTMDARALCRL